MGYHTQQHLSRPRVLHIISDAMLSVTSILKLKVKIYQWNMLDKIKFDKTQLQFWTVKQSLEAS